MRRTHTSHLLGSDSADVRVNLHAITFPQSACPACAHVGSGQPPWRWCRCETEYVTVSSLTEYKVLLKSASPPRPPKLARGEASLLGRSTRRAG